MNEGPFSTIAIQKRSGRFPEEFRMPAGVRKSWKPEPAGRRRCAMGFSVSGRFWWPAPRRMWARAWEQTVRIPVGMMGSRALTARRCSMLPPL